MTMTNNNKNNTKNCTTCFNKFCTVDQDPCYTCDDTFSNYVNVDVYKDDGRPCVTKEYDTVSNPSHYHLIDGIEVRDIIAVLVDKMYEEGTPAVPLFISDYVQMMQYLMRFMKKNGVEDLRKAKYYLDELIKAYDE